MKLRMANPATIVSDLQDKEAEATEQKIINEGKTELSLEPIYALTIVQNTKHGRRTHLFSTT